jgi:hypothetical protein
MDWIIPNGLQQAINLADAAYYVWQPAERAERWTSRLFMRGGIALDLAGAAAIDVLDAVRVGWFVLPNSDRAININQGSNWHWYEALEDDLWGGTLYMSDGLGSIDVRGSDAIALTRYFQSKCRPIKANNLYSSLQQILNHCP